MPIKSDNSRLLAKWGPQSNDLPNKTAQRIATTVAKINVLVYRHVCFIDTSIKATEKARQVGKIRP